MRAMVIDDSRAIRKLLARSLAEAGFEVAEAGNGLEALELLGTQGPADLALVDWNMPEMNGLEFVKSVRANPGYASMQLLMVTTETEISQVARALEAGANEYMMKPFTPGALVEKLELMGLGAASGA